MERYGGSMVGGLAGVGAGLSASQYAATAAVDAPREMRGVEGALQRVLTLNQVAAGVTEIVDDLRRRLLGISEPNQAGGDKSGPTPVHCELELLSLSLATLEGRMKSLFDKIGDLQRV